MDRPPALLSQRAYAADPEARDLGRALLWNYEFTCAGAGEETFVVTFDGSREVQYPMPPSAEERQTITVDMLDLREARSALASVRGITFPEPAVPFIHHTTEIHLGSGTPAPIEAYLEALLCRFDSVRLTCAYVYAIGAGPAELPVFLSTEPGVSPAAALIRRWIEENRPPSDHARLRFAVTLPPVLQLDQVIVAMADVIL